MVAGDGDAGGVVGAGDEDELGLRGDGGEKTVEWKGEGVVGLDADEAGAHDADGDVVHEEGGGGDEGLVVLFEEGEAEEVDGLVDAVGEKELVGREAEVGGGGDLGVFALGIDGEIRRGYRLQALEDAG